MDLHKLISKIKTHNPSISINLSTMSVRELPEAPESLKLDDQVRVVSMVYTDPEFNTDWFGHSFLIKQSASNNEIVGALILKLYLMFKNNLLGAILQDSITDFDFLETEQINEVLNDPEIKELFLSL